jgi:hypothetical protein
MTTPQGERAAIIETEAALIDENFFGLFSRLMEAAVMSRDEKSAKELAEIQQVLLEKTAIGQEIKKQNDEAEAAVNSLKEAGKSGLTREKLVDLIVESPTEIRTATLVRLARSGMDYSFFQILSSKIDQAVGDEKDRLTKLRESLLKMTAEMDLELQEQAAKIKQVIDKIVSAPDVEKTTEQILPAVNELFLDVLRQEIQAAREKSDLERGAKLQKIVDVIQKASAPPPEYDLLEKLLAAETEEKMKSVLESQPDMVSSEFVQLINGVLAQAETQGEDPAVLEQLRSAHRMVLRMSMQKNLAQ